MSARKPAASFRRAPRAQPLARALAAEDKAQRRHAILDATERLFRSHGDRLASMAEVADAAGLAKGTVYLYFDSKEAMFVAAHERRMDAFFGELIAALDATSPFGFDDLAALVRRHLTGPPDAMGLAAVCMGFSDGAPAAGDTPLAALSARIGQWLARAGEGLERRFAQLPPGEGTRLLVHGYALIVGLWHLLGAPCAAEAAVRGSMPASSYADEVELALGRYWRQVIDAAEPAVRTPATGRS